MDNRIAYPFERNRYFYGKLLTVRDFDLEQKYFNDKRRMLNKLVHGPGIIYGLGVARYDEETIFLEPGVALDYQGREIVVSKFEMHSLAQIEGLTEKDYVKDAYLCIKYDEVEFEQMHSLNFDSEKTENNKENNRLREGYKLYIREDKPETSNISCSRFIEGRKYLDTDKKMLLTMLAPKYVNEGDEIDFKVRLEKTQYTVCAGSEFEVVLEGFETDGSKRSFNFNFEDELSSEKRVLEKSFKLVTTVKQGQFGVINIKRKNSIDNDKNTLMVKVGKVPVNGNVICDYNDQTLEDSGIENHICLAKLKIFKSGAKLLIENKDIVQVPFNQYVRNIRMVNHMAVMYESLQKCKSSNIETVEATVSQLDKGHTPTVEVKYGKDKKTLGFEFGIPKTSDEDKYKSGVVELAYKNEPKNDKVLYSDEIDHKLGTGNVNVSLGLIKEDSEEIFIGDMGLFKETKFNVSLGALVNPKSGKFKIVYRVSGDRRSGKIKVIWWAYRA